jgi:hypothetical protein
MKTSFLVPCLFVCASISTADLAHAQEKPPPFSVSYDHARLTTITVNDGRLRYVWQTQRQLDEGESPLLPASLASYDRHEINVWLTKKEMARFREWVVRHKVFDFKKAYPTRPGAPTYGAAFQSGLTVVLGDRKHAVGWDGDSQTPETLAKAIQELTALAEEVQKSRNK